MANVDLGKYRRFVQIFWDPEPINDTALDQPVWCLGRAYSLSEKRDTGSLQRASSPSDQPFQDFSIERILPNPNPQKETTTTTSTDTEAQEREIHSSLESLSSSFMYESQNATASGWPVAFMEDFKARFGMTYRSSFGIIHKSDNPRAASSLSLSMRIKGQLKEQNGFTSDSGWGCMIRSGQSLLANTMSIMDLGRDWRRGKLPDEERRLISQFADDSRAPYSIHNFVRCGEAICGKYPGEWFGPSATARCIQELVNSRGLPLRVYSTGDSPDVYEDCFMKIANLDGKCFHPTLILVGTRLGIDKITPVYWEAVIASLQMAQSVGIAGGRPSSSHYFVGSQGHFLFYLDPHHTCNALPFHSDISHYGVEDIDTCHTTRLRRIHVREMDPSMLIGFLIKSQEDWIEWKRRVKHVQGKTIIHVADSYPAHEVRDATGRSAIDEVEPLSDDEDLYTGDAT